MATEATTAGQPAAATGDRAWFRGDVDGLRAIAIILVVAYHAGWQLFSAGFIGVDVFFVISGYLITRNLVREVGSTDRVRLIEFWARRVRRLVPALALVVVVTLVASLIVLPLYQQTSAVEAGRAAIVYLSNFYFANQAQDYFAADITGNPFLHTWSLGVEEQFYLVWPVLVAATWAVAHRFSGSRDARRRGLAVTFGIVLVASLAWSAVLTADGSAWAFFGLPTRAWEFAAAGLLALATVNPHRALRSVGTRTALGAAGFLALGAAVLLIDDSTPWPGLWALLPVTATVLIILGGETAGGTWAPTPIGQALSLPPAQWVGRVSYSWYLWHWPAIVLVAAATSNATVKLATVSALASLPVAAVAYHFFETPLRFLPRLRRSRPLTFASAAVVTVAVLGLTYVVAPTSLRTGAGSEVAALEAPPGSSMSERVAVAVRLYEQRSEVVCPKVGAVTTEDGDEYCIDGDPEGSTSILLLGDSHAGQWRDVLSEVAKDRDVKLLVRQHNGCPPYLVDTTTPESDTKTEECRKEQAATLRVIEALSPDAVVVANWSGRIERIVAEDGSTPPVEERIRLWEEGARELFDVFADQGIRLGVILDEPTLPFNAAKCLDREGSAEACQTTRKDSLERSKPLLEAERRAIEDHPGAEVLDMTTVLCNEDTCLLEVDGTLTYVDTHHLTDAYAMKLFPEISDLVDRLLG